MTEWISVTDQLPEEYKRVLVSGDDGVFRGYCWNDGTWQCCPQGSYAGDGLVYGVTHWAELPAPPKKKSSGDLFYDQMVKFCRNGLLETMKKIDTGNLPEAHND